MRRHTPGSRQSTTLASAATDATSSADTASDAAATVGGEPHLDADLLCQRLRPRAGGGGGGGHGGDGGDEHARHDEHE